MNEMNFIDGIGTEIEHNFAATEKFVCANNQRNIFSWEIEHQMSIINIWHSLTAFCLNHYDCVSLKYDIEFCGWTPKSPTIVK